MSEQLIPRGGHKLSAKSSKLQRDTFIFQPSGSYVKVIAGFNQEVTQASTKTVCRWLHSLMPPIFRRQPDRWGFHLRRISLKKCGMPFRYAYSSKDEVIPENDSILGPGDYGWCWNFSDANDGIERSYPKFPFDIGNVRQISFAELTKFTTLTAKDRRPYEMEMPLTEAVEMRNACFLTNRSRENANLTPAWIIPPLWVFQVTNGVDAHEPYHTAENAVLVAKDIKLHWDNNEFAVDVEDHYRIVRFRKLPAEIDSLIPQNLRLEPDSGRDKFLRQHFIWCLEVNIVGGDNCETWSDEAIMKLIQQVGLLSDDKREEDSDDYDEDEDEDDGDDDGVRKVKEVLPDDHELWRSELGQELFKMKNDGSLFNS